MRDDFEHLTDGELLRLATSEPEAFAAFYRRHVEGVLRFFAGRTRDREVAADLMAETFAAALLALPSFRERTEPLAWLYSIARHKLVDSYRRGRVRADARRRLRIERLELDDQDLERVGEIATAKAVGDRLRLILDSLPAGQREALEARVVDDREYAEIAHELRCSEVVVRKRVSRALEALRTRLEDEA